MKRYLVLLDVLSLLKLGAVIGLGAGVVLAPISAMIAASTGDGSVVMTIFVLPVAAALNGALGGLLAYPVYWAITKKYRAAAVLSGHFQEVGGPSNNSLKPTAPGGPAA